MNLKKIGTSKNIDYNSLQVTTVYGGVETVITNPPQDLHIAINSSAALGDTPATMTIYTSATKTIPSDLSDHKTLFPDYDSDISPYMLQQLVVKW